MEDPNLPIAKIQLTFDKMSPDIKYQINIFLSILITLMISTIIYIYFYIIFKLINKYILYKKQIQYEEV